MDLDITGFVELFTGWNHSHHCYCCCCCCCCWRSEDVELSGVRPVIIIVIFIIIIIVIVIIIIIIITIITIILGMTCPRRLVRVGDLGWRPWRRGRR